jgi:hypothetical protein
MDHKSFKAEHTPDGNVQYYHKKGTRWYKVSLEKFKELFAKTV